MSTLKIILAIFLGALTNFIWSFVSWSKLDLHGDSISAFENEEEIAPILAEGSRGHGVYVYPWLDKDTPDQRREHDEWIERTKEGPFVFAVVRPGAKSGQSMARTMGVTFATQLVAAFLVALALVAASPRLNYIGRVLFVAVFGLFAWIVGYLPAVTWWEFPWAYAFPYAIDLLAGWFLAGLSMAVLIKGRSS